MHFHEWISECPLNKSPLIQVIVWRQTGCTYDDPFHWGIHWNKNVVILTKFSSLAALEVVILTTSSAASDEHFIKMKTFPFQCKCVIRPQWVNRIIWRTFDTDSGIRTLIVYFSCLCNAPLIVLISHRQICRIFGNASYISLFMI